MHHWLRLVPFDVKKRFINGQIDELSCFGHKVTQSRQIPLLYLTLTDLMWSFSVFNHPESVRPTVTNITYIFICLSVASMFLHAVSSSRYFSNVRVVILSIKKKSRTQIDLSSWRSFWLFVSSFICTIAVKLFAVSCPLYWPPEVTSPPGGWSSVLQDEVTAEVNWSKSRRMKIKYKPITMFAHLVKAVIAGILGVFQVF